MSELEDRAKTEHLLDRLVRRERGRLLAGLVRRLGDHNLELAEDVAQEALITALSAWPCQPLPRDPAAWLARVARNKAIDRLRREARETTFEPDEHAGKCPSLDTSGEAERGFGDPELALIHLSCHPALVETDRLALTLRIVSGFTARELAEAFLSSEVAIGQRLSRARRKLQGLERSALRDPASDDPRSRHHDVLKVIYLMFSLGYAPRSGDALIRREVALEALRLVQALSESADGSTPATHALAALICFQSSRFESREDRAGRPVLLRDQDRRSWNTDLIVRALTHLRAAGRGSVVGRYHVEAAIAACYATSASWESIDWSTVLSLYDDLERLTASPVVGINAAVARAFAGEPAQALARLDELAERPTLERYAPYHVARANILSELGRNDEAADSFRRAIATGVSAPIVGHLESRLLELSAPVARI